MITSKLPQTGSSIFSVMSQLAKKHGALNLSQGFPNFESDPYLIDLVAQAMKNGHNQYAPMAGDPELLKEIANKYRVLHQRAHDAASEITITAGATQAIFTAIAAVIGKGDEVLIFTPAYDCYEPSIQLMGGITVPVQLQAPGYKPDWELVADRITERTKMIIINSPHNPSGMLFSESDMLQLEALVVQHQLIVLSDEVYEHIIFDGNIHQSAARFPKLSQRTFITASFGKTFHNTGWKVGYCVAPEILMKEFQKVHQFNVFSVNHPVQKALAVYMRDPGHYLDLSDFYQQKREYFNDLLKGSRFQITPSKGTYFQLLDFSAISTESDVAFAERLTKEHKIATIPTSVFNEKNEDFKQIRVCFAKTEETLKKGAELLRVL